MSAVTEAATRKWQHYWDYGVCPKCDGKYKTTKYHDEKPEGVGIDGCSLSPEHLHVTCDRCGYWWPCKPKDTLLAPTPTSPKEAG